MIERAVERWVDQHQLIPVGERGIVALSGGPDSLCALAVLMALSRRRPLELVAVHVDHGLREASASEALRAVELAEGLGVRCIVRRAEGLACQRGNLQERAREARLALLGEEASTHGATWIATGHTADDQAETVLMRLLRGAGPAGLAAMRPRQGVMVRPLLGTWRRDIEDYLRQRGLTPIRDPSNAGRSYLRNRVRHDVLPALEAENPSAAQALVRLAQTCREETDALEAWALETWRAARRADGLDLAALGTVPVGVLHRVLAIDVAHATGSRRRLQRVHLEALSQLVSSRAGSQSVDLPGVRVERRYGRMTVRPQLGQEKVPVVDEQPILGVGSLALDPQRRLNVWCGPVGAGERLALADRCLARRPVVRGWRAGDRIAVGPGQHRKVSRVLLDAKLPSVERAAVPLVVVDEAVVLVVGVRRAWGWAPQEASLGVHFVLQPVGGGVNLLHG